MGLKQTFDELRTFLDEALRALYELQVTVRDKPDDSALADVFENATEDMIGWLSEALAAAEGAGEVLAPPVDLEAARGTLVTIHERCLLVDRRFGELVSYEQIAELAELGDSRGRTWRTWAESVHETLGSCREPLEAIRAGLLAAWQELAERAGIGSISVQTTAIGQQIPAGALTPEAMP